MHFFVFFTSIDCSKEVDISQLEVEEILKKMDRFKKKEAIETRERPREREREREQESEREREGERLGVCVRKI